MISSAIKAHYQRNTIRVPSNVAAITRVDENESPLDKGSVESIWDGVNAMYQTGYQPGIALCIRHRGQVVLNRTIGHARGHGPADSGEEAVPLELNTPISLFSSSKAFTAILVHMLAEDGVINLAAPVCEYIPEFAAQGKHKVTVEQVLAHQAGIPSFPTHFAIEHMEEWDAVIEVLCRMPAIAKPGKITAYHAVTGGFILAEVAQRATGLSLPDILDQKIRQPLGMNHFTYGVPVEKNNDVALNYFMGPPLPPVISSLAEKALGMPFDEACELSNEPIFLNNVVPAGNVYSTAEEATRVYQVLLDGGQWKGQRIMQAETVRQTIEPFGRMRFDRLLRLPIRYSRGLILGHPLVSMYGARTPMAFGHLGFLHILCWADIERDIAVSLITTGKAAIGPHLKPLGQIVNAINSTFPQRRKDELPAWTHSLPRGLSAVI